MYQSRSNDHLINCYQSFFFCFIAGLFEWNVQFTFHPYRSMGTYTRLYSSEFDCEPSSSNRFFYEESTTIHLGDNMTFNYRTKMPRTKPNSIGFIGNDQNAFEKKLQAGGRRVKHVRQFHLPNSCANFTCRTHFYGEFIDEIEWFSFKWYF